MLIIKVLLLGMMFNSWACLKLNQKTYLFVMGIKQIPTVLAEIVSVQLFQC